VPLYHIIVPRHAISRSHEMSLPPSIPSSLPPPLSLSLPIIYYVCSQKLFFDTRALSREMHLFGDLAAGIEFFPSDNARKENNSRLAE